MHRKSYFRRRGILGEDGTWWTCYFEPLVVGISCTCILYTAKQKSQSGPLNQIFSNFPFMKRRYVDLEVYESRNMVNDGNVDYQYWFEKSNEERLHAAGVMTSVAFGEPEFFKKKVDRTVFSARKHSL
jgi:hypothetical protein